MAASCARPRRPSAPSTFSERSSSAANTAEQYPHYSKQIIAGAKQSFVDGQHWAYAAGIIAIVLGAAIVFFLFPKKADEERLLAQYQAEDTAKTTTSA